MRRCLCKKIPEPRACACMHACLPCTLAHARAHAARRGARHAAPPALPCPAGGRRSGGGRRNLWRTYTLSRLCLRAPRAARRRSSSLRAAAPGSSTAGDFAVSALSLVATSQPHARTVPHCSPITGCGGVNRQDQIDRYTQQRRTYEAKPSASQDSRRNCLLA